MKKYTLQDSFAGTFSSGSYRKIPMGIPLEGKKVLDIYIIRIDFHYVATAGSISFFEGLSYKDSRFFQGTYTNNQSMAALKDWIVFHAYRYSAPGESLQEEVFYEFIKPYTIWSSPSVVVGYSDIVGTLTPAAVYADVLGEIRTPTDEEYTRLKIEQRQERL